MRRVPTVEWVAVEPELLNALSSGALEMLTQGSSPPAVVLEDSCLSPLL
jgi:hypothetical protein